MVLLLRNRVFEIVNPLQPRLARTRVPPHEHDGVKTFFPCGSYHHVLGALSKSVRVFWGETLNLAGLTFLGDRSLVVS